MNNLIRRALIALVLYWACCAVFDYVMGHFAGMREYSRRKRKNLLTRELPLPIPALPAPWSNSDEG
jgi:hypothetical protein